MDDMITLFRGDDTAFGGAKSLRVTIETKESLAGCCAEFGVCGVVKRVRDVSTGTFLLSFTGEDTAKMPLGEHVATLRVFDDESRRRTVSNTIRVRVTERVDLVYNNEQSVNVSIGAQVAWRNVRDKPSINGVVLEGDKTTKELGIKGVVEAELVDLPEDYTTDDLRTALNKINACLRASMAALALAACAFLAPLAGFCAATETNRVETQRMGAVSSKSNVVTDVCLAGLATEGALDSVSADLASHVSAKSGNPHGVTAADVKVSLVPQAETQTTTATNEAGEAVTTVATNATGKATISVGDDSATFYTADEADARHKVLSDAISAIPAVSVSNGVVSVDGEKSAALDAGDGRGIAVGRATNSTIVATLDTNTLTAVDRWEFSARQNSIYADPDTDKGVYQTNVYTSVLYPDGGRILTDTMIPASQFGVDGAVKNADEAYHAASADEAKTAESLFDESNGTFVKVTQNPQEDENGEEDWALRVGYRDYYADDGSYTNVTSRLVPDGTDFVTEKTLDAAIKVQSVNGATGAVVLAASDVGVGLTNGVITIDGESIAPLTEHQSLDAYAKTEDVDKKVAAQGEYTTAVSNKLEKAIAAEKAAREKAGYLTAEKDPNFAAWTNGTSIVAGEGASGYGVVIGDGASSGVGVAIGRGASSGGGVVIGDGAQGLGVVIGDGASSGGGVAIGANAHAYNGDSIVMSATYFSGKTYEAVSQDTNTFNISTPSPSRFWFNAIEGETARSLQSYLDERATTNDLAKVEAMISATDATFSNAVLVAARALVRSKLESLDAAKSSIGETIAALQSIYETETK